MQASATSVAIFAAVFVSIFVPMMLSGKDRKAAEEKARERRLAEARMNARLLRLNI